MIAEHAHRADIPDELNRVKRLGAATDNVSGGHELIAVLPESGPVQKDPQLVKAAVDVADYIYSHFLPSGFAASAFLSYAKFEILTKSSTVRFSALSLGS